jgi:single stranded DNA-binding protein
MQPLALGAVSTPPSGASRKWGRKRRIKSCIYHVQLIGFLGKDPEKRQVRGKGTNFTVLSVATQQSWEDSNDEWMSKTEWHRVAAFNRLGESIAQSLRKGDHILLDGLLASSKSENENGKSKKGKAAKVTVLGSVRANSVPRLSRAESEVPTQPTGTEARAESFVCPAFRPRKTNLIARPLNCRGYAPPLTLDRQWRFDIGGSPQLMIAPLLLGTCREHVPALLCRPSLSLGVTGVRSCPWESLAIARSATSKCIYCPNYPSRELPLIVNRFLLTTLCFSSHPL